MKYPTRNLSILVLLIITAFLTIPVTNAFPGEDATGDGIDTTRLSTIEFTVVGLDSASVPAVQDKLMLVEGVYFNFACWTDTVIFIEYDTLLTNKQNLMDAIKKMGYRPVVRFE